MASASEYFNAPGGWSWPDDVPPSKAESEDTARRRTNGKSRDSSGDASSSNTGPGGSSTKPKAQRHWRPRTCRICLETVLPTFNPPSENLPGVFQGRPSVTYESEAGRLLRPCKCKGSSRYVHESCLQQWRHADPSYGRRNFWQCPTCGFRYRLERMQWGAWISSAVAQVLLTLSIFLTVVFLLGYVADPIVNYYLHSYTTTYSIPTSRHGYYGERYSLAEEYEGTWLGHFIKGLASLGILGFIKVLFTISPWQWLNFRAPGLASGGNRGATGRDRIGGFTWLIIVVGVCTFLYSVWKVVRAWSRRVLEKAGEKVMDVQGDDDDDDNQDE